MTDTMTAYITIKKQEPYPWREVAAGVKACGDLTVAVWDPKDYNSHSIAATWNKYGTAARVADQIKAAGGTHIAIENGYMRREQGYFAMGINGINGRDERQVLVRRVHRFRKLQIRVEPRRENGNHILVIGQRGGSYNDMAMPNDWPGQVIKQLNAITDRPIHYRAHPGRERLPHGHDCLYTQIDTRIPIGDALRGAHAVVVYTSNVATDALIQGVPVFFCGPAIAVQEAAEQGITNIETPVPVHRDNQMDILQDLASRQFHINEIERGTAWRILTGRYL